MVCQALMAPDATMIWIGDARPGAVHDLAAARADRLVQALELARIRVLGDEAYTGAHGTFTTVIRRPKDKHLSRSEAYAQCR